MSRERDRIAKRLEKNPVQECNRIQKKFYPELFSKFEQVTDPRHRSYIKYSSREMLGTVYYKGIAGISSMQGMTREFNNETVAGNLYSFMGSKEKEYLPHGVTVNEFLERLDPLELEEIQSDIVYKMIRRKTFDDAKVLGRWLVLVDGSELDEGKTKKNENYLSRCYNKGKDNEFIKYHRSILEAKIYFGNNLVCSIATEPIENSAEYNEKKLSEEEIKQDCESKAFVRIAWITNIEITNKNAQKLVKAGRSRWKIENQGFNRQKRWQGNIEHACSWNERAQKNHYLMEQISDFMKQLYEYFYLKKNEIKKTQKNISSELLASFGRQLTETEDIPAQLNNSVIN